MRILRFLICGLLLLAARAGYAQTDSLAGIARALRWYQQQAPQEKLFVHLDRSHYLSGDVLWCKLYLVEAASHRPLPLSQVAYVELLDARQQPVLQTKIPLRQATGRGSLALPASLRTGTYTLRAYTRWMQNASPEYYFHAPIQVVNTLAARLPAPAAPDSVAGYDVQFFPEGGNLVRGLRSRVAVKVLAPDGRGTAAEGSVLDERGQVVATFRTLKFGMGRFELTPAVAGSAYTAVVRVAGQPPLTRPLPAAAPEGYALRVDAADPAQLTVTVAASAGRAGGGVYLLGHAGGQPFVAEVRALSQGRAQFVVPRGSLPAGVAHLTVFDEQRRPVAERLCFRRPEPGLSLSVRPDQSRYGPRAPVGLALAAAGPAAAVPASLSVAVYRLDSLERGPTPGIGSYLWLSADLRGYIEQPDYYFGPVSVDSEEALDNLLLTQGWRRFRWDEVLTRQPRLPYAPELNGHLIPARLTHTGSTAPAGGVTAYLASPGRRVLLYNATSRADGGLQFEVKDFFGPRNVVVQPNLRTDSTVHVQLLSPFSAAYARYRAPQLPPLPEALRPDLTRRHLQLQTQTAFFGARQVAHAPLQADSTAFYGRPDASYRLDDYNRFRVLEEVLREYVPGVDVRQRADGFHLLVADQQRRTFLAQDPLMLLDGVPFFHTNRVMKFDPLRIQRLDVLHSAWLQGPIVHSGVLSFVTYHGDLGGQALDPRALLQEYEGLQLPRDFYAPRYDSPQARQSRLPDRRALLYWNPDVRVQGGSASPLSFYTGDEAGRYLVVVQGLTDTGQAGSASCVLEVQPGGVALTR